MIEGEILQALEYVNGYVKSMTECMGTPLKAANNFKRDGTWYIPQRI